MSSFSDFFLFVQNLFMAEIFETKRIYISWYSKEFQNSFFSFSRKYFFFQKKVNAQIKGCFTIEALIPFHPFLLLNPSLLLSIETVHWPMSQHSFLGYFSLGPFDFDDFRRPSPSILVVFTTGTFL